jgi:hypothetical protein
MFDSSTIDAANIVALAALAEIFDNIAIANVASGTGAGAITGLGFTPDWVLWATADNTDDNAKTWTATSTTLTLTGRSTTTATTIQYIAGLLT